MFKERSAISFQRSAKTKNQMSGMFHLQPANIPLLHYSTKGEAFLLKAIRMLRPYIEAVFSLLLKNIQQF